MMNSLRPVRFLLFAVGVVIGLGFDLTINYIHFGPDRFGPDKFIPHILLGLLSGLCAFVLFRVFAPEYFRKFVTRHFGSSSKGRES
jgi:hypothetical protein